ncbi:outer membrane insertion C- signal [Shivajiella indica]|uniref:Outer membrane insertion C- signal n=1 Tax=Shivajiella indica TaxID=872115 RepID=A0ABW5BBX8_9BACT
MKKVILLFFVFSTMMLWNRTNAQELGLRFGDVLGNNVAIDGVFSLGEFSRVHGDVSFGDRGVGIEALWNFVYRPLGQEAFHWYAGVGPSLLLGDPFILGVSGEIGLEYTFREVPLSLSLDWRPRVNIVETTDFVPGPFGFNIRYVFGRN